MTTFLSRFGRGTMLGGAAVCAVVIGLLLWWLLPLGNAQPRGTVVFSTGVRSGVYEKYGELLKHAVDRDLPGVRMELRASEGSQENVARVATGKADFTIAAADAVEKYREDNGKGAGSLRGCARLYDDYLQLVVAESSGIHKVTDLRGKRVAVGQVGSGVRLIADRLLTTAGLDPEHDITPVGIGIDKMNEQLRLGKIDAFFWSGGLPTVSVRELSETFPVRFVPLGDLVDALRHAGGEGRFYRTAVMPRDAYPAAHNDGTVMTLAVANLLVTRGSLDPGLTEGVTRTVIASRDGIGQQVHAAQKVDLRTAIYTDPLELHEGAQQYYRSVKP
ncbi:TAXI family TRAP transporter solute-binding subunit [Streptomyces sp. SID11385]|uniref:TAXI family TRAP transporter solute-binding subunit n=1 Tax=Streptomyces sp. SID11385 TaxID=2706031 RepID=UPI0013CA879E|nr:TAXI family TRAP transporter solute-binding subunit [Streptomyces sp. SID11385]NEA42939.1 TAXI family TRAP transporter solute-binding subunit [Streptomyces sp. SID11385]